MKTYSVKVAGKNHRKTYHVTASSLKEAKHIARQRYGVLRRVWLP